GGVRPAGDEAGDVGGVDDQQRPDLVGDRPEGREVDRAGVGGGAGDDGLGPLCPGQVADGVVVEGLRLVVDPVGHELVEPPGEVHRGAVGEVATLVEAHAHDLVARLEEGQVHA